MQNMLQIIQAETVLCNEVTRVLDGVLSGVMKRDNQAVQTGLTAYNQLVGELAKAEATRSKLYEQLCAQFMTKPGDGMTVLIACLAEDRRPSFSYAMRAFRSAVYQMYTMNRCLNSYTNSQLTTLEAFLVELMPERDIGTYSADGSRQATGRPILVNSLG